LNWPRGPDRIDSASARCSAVNASSDNAGKRGDCMFGMIFPFRSSARWAIASFVVACNGNL
jgi:hypothetical protein